MSQVRPEEDILSSINILISIGNSDDRLSQQEWAAYIKDMRMVVRDTVQQATLLPAAVHGEWFSAPDSPWQNANWCVEMPPGTASYRALKARVVEVRTKYRQDSVAWTEGAVQFL